MGRLQEPSCCPVARGDPRLRCAGYGGTGGTPMEIRISRGTERGTGWYWPSLPVPPVRTTLTGLILSWIPVSSSKTELEPLRHRRESHLALSLRAVSPIPDLLDRRPLGWCQRPFVLPD